MVHVDWVSVDPTDHERAIARAQLCGIDMIEELTVEVRASRSSIEARVRLRQSTLVLQGVDVSSVIDRVARLLANIAEQRASLAGVERVT